MNRAKKDLSAAQPEVKQIEGDAVTLSVGGAVCTITAPLGSSACTCPSSTMCRHRMSAILWLKEQAARKNAPPGEAAVPSDGEPPDGVAEELTALLSAYPTQVLTRQLGERRVSALVQRESSGERAAIREGSAVTVELPWIPATVRFICPLEHSSCTCHSRSFCTHKAEALLTWQLRQRIATEESLLAAVRSDTGSVLERREICVAVGATLADWMCAGLTRLPASSLETAERLAGLCHTSALPSLERAMRRLHGELQGYFARSAAFRAEALLRRMSAVWRLASALRTAPEPEALQLAGAFREEYQGVGDLRLYLLGLREVDLAGGYAGTVYVFLETQKHRYYAYRDLRPQFYEGQTPASSHRGHSLGTARDTAPGVELPHRPHRRPGQWRGQPLRHHPMPGDAAAKDSAGIGASSGGGGGGFLRPAAPQPPRSGGTGPAGDPAAPPGELQEYDRVEQRFTLRLLDGAGRDIWLTVRYREGERAVVEALERLAGRWEQEPDLRPVFFGELYRADGRLCLYPIECFTNWEGTP